MTNHLFSPYEINGLQLKNRVVMAPMCQYSVTARDGKPNEWHYVHYLSRAIGGAALIIMEMTDVEPDGRITDFDLGIWSDDHIPAFARIIDGVHAHGAKIGIQIAHAGRKAEDAKEPVAPSAIPYPGSRYKMPRALTVDEVNQMVQLYADAARRAVQAGVDMIELHGYADGGYGMEHAIKLSKAYHAAGVDVFHVSSGGEGPVGERKPGNYPGYQVPFARKIREALGVPVVAVGMLEDPALAQSVICSEEADLVAIARGMLRDPYWTIHAAKSLRSEYTTIPKQYERAYH